MQVTGVKLGSDATVVPAEDTTCSWKVAKALQALLSIRCHKRQHLREKDLKMDFQVVNVPLITSESVPAVGKKSSSMNLHVMQQEGAGPRSLIHYPNLNPGGFVSKRCPTHLDINNSVSSEHSLALAYLYNYKGLP